MMNESLACSILGATQSLLSSCGESNRYEHIISQLSELVSATGSNEELRNVLCTSYSLRCLCTDILAELFNVHLHSENEVARYLRIARGIVLLVRNLSVSQYFDLDVSNMFLSMRKFILNIEPTQALFPLCLQAYLQVFANHVIKGEAMDRKMQSLFNILQESTIQVIQDTATPDLKSPLNAILFYYLQDKSFVCDDPHSHITDFVFYQGFVQAKNVSFSSDVERLLNIIITRHSFKLWLESHLAHKHLDSIVQVAQLVVTSKDDWDIDESSTIIQWDFSLFRNLANRSILLLTSSETDDVELASVHLNLVRSLDIITEICKYEPVRQYLHSQNALPQFVSLLKTTHENTEVKTPKSRKLSTQNNSTALSAGKKQFPIVKSLIIEILAFMCYQSYPNQEAMRELHGLELILSNCVIDEDNPYIKEHSILCLKFLLENNQKNQDFVAQLEAKQIVDGDILTQAGYELSIENGNVKVKNSTT